MDQKGMDFRELVIEDKDRLNRYLLPLGEGSCQHNFAALFALADKYETRFCEKDGFLFLRQSRKDEEGYQSFLMPFGEEKREEGIRLLLEETKQAGRKLKLATITASAAALLESAFPGRFTLREERSFTEYIYRRETLAFLPGKSLRNKRNDYNRFHRSYGDRLAISALREEDFPELLGFHEDWIQKHREDPGFDALCSELHAVRRVLPHWRELSFRGIVLRMDGVFSGYACGCPISAQTFDMFFEKGDYRFRDIYRCLVTDMVRLQCADARYINREEDLGDPGLRESKLSYQPDRLLKKYIAWEI